MIRGISLVLVTLVLVCTYAQIVPHCSTPPQFHARISQYDHGRDEMHRYTLVYDAVNQQQVFFEYTNEVIPGSKIFEYLILPKQGVEYKFDLRSHQCTKAPARPWRNISVPENATLTNEFTLGGPTEAFLAQEWSDRIPLRQNARNIIQFTLNKCYPIKHISIMGDITHTVTTNFYDIVIGIPNPNDFVIPRECLQTKLEQDQPFWDGFWNFS